MEVDKQICYAINIKGTAPPPDAWLALNLHVAKDALYMMLGTKFSSSTVPTKLHPVASVAWHFSFDGNIFGVLLSAPVSLLDILVSNDNNFVSHLSSDVRIATPVLFRGLVT